MDGRYRGGRLNHPHEDGSVHYAGLEPRDARAVAILFHGRGGSATDILTLATEIDMEDISYIAPEAAGHTWYPYRFTEPFERNQPYLDSALRRVGEMIERTTSAGVAMSQIVLLGFSQGACLVLEYAARNTARYGGLVGLSGGLIGPDDVPREYAGSLDGTPTFLGCSDIDPHIPVERVHETADVLERLGAEVTKRIYPGWIHSVNTDEIGAVRNLMAGVKA